MRTKNFKLCVAALSLLGLQLLANQALAAEFWLSAAPTTVTMPDGNVIQMWGYKSCTAAFATCDAVASVPGPALNVPSADAVLTVNLRNELPVATSLVINGLIKVMTPVWDDNTSGPRFAAPATPTPAELAKRVRSFDAEVTTGGVGVYTWANPRSGTFLYQSGTQPQVQVQMGLYGAASRNADDVAPAQAYAGITYDNQVTLLYSEVDPALHAAVAGGTYGPCPDANPCGNVSSTLNYAPKYFLINGVAYPHASLSSIVPSGNAGTTLLRVLNAGLTTHVPMLQDSAWDVIAEDGNAYSNRRKQYTALLPAAKTLDLLLAPPALGAPTRFAIMDRRLGLSNAGLPDGGMLAFLNLGTVAAASLPSAPPNVAPVAGNDSYDAVKGMALVVASPGVLLNDTDTDGGPYPVKAVTANGSTTLLGNYALNANGSFAYTPPASLVTYPAVDTFTYKSTDGQLLSADATVTITVRAPTLASLPVIDNFDRGVDASTLGASWSQAIDTGPDGPNLHIVGNQVSAFATELGGQAIWNNELFGAKQGAAVRLTGSANNSGIILKATGGATPDAPANFIRVRFQPTNGGEVVVSTMLGGSNTSTYVNHAAMSTAFAAGDTLSATVDDKALVLVWRNGAFLGGVQLPKAAAWIGTGRVGIQLQAVGATADDFGAATLP